MKHFIFIIIFFSQLNSQIVLEQELGDSFFNSLGLLSPYGPAGNFSMTFNEDLTGVIEYQSNAPDNFGWSGSNPYILTGEGDGINAYVSGDALTFTALDSICIQYNLIK